MLFTILYVIIDIVKKYVYPAVILSQLNILIIYILNNDVSLQFGNYLISTSIYFLFNLIVVNSYFYKPIISFCLFISLFLLSMNSEIGENGIYFPITLIIFIIYVLFRFGNKIFLYWKNNLEL